jgi:hypothetical protein
MSPLSSNREREGILRKLQSPILALGVAVAVLVCCGELATHFLFSENWKELNQIEHHALYEVDHQSVFDACLQLWTEHHPTPTALAPDILFGDEPRIPQAIRDLKAVSVEIDDSGVVVKLRDGFGGEDPMGFEAVIAGSGEQGKGAYHNNFHSKQLLPKLWYFSAYSITAEK